MVPRKTSPPRRRGRVCESPMGSSRPSSLIWEPGPLDKAWMCSLPSWSARWERMHSPGGNHYDHRERKTLGRSERSKWRLSGEQDADWDAVASQSLLIRASEAGISTASLANRFYQPTHIRYRWLLHSLHMEWKDAATIATDVSISSRRV
jgi:hypothetical protein